MCYKEVIRKVGIDKVAHFALSAFLCLAIARFLPLWVGITATMALGIGKEVYDAKTGGKVDWKDLIADGLGIVLATIITMI
jgi:uncharacterized protein YfiM (DUF2279 family)